MSVRLIETCAVDLPDTTLTGDWRAPRSKSQYRAKSILEAWFPVDRRKRFAKRRTPEAMSLGLFEPVIAWSKFETATPLADLRAAKLELIALAEAWDSTAFLGMNQEYLNEMLCNQNPTDLGGMAAMNSVFSNLSAVNMILAAEGLPSISIVDDGYLSRRGFRYVIETGTFVAAYVPVRVQERTSSEVAQENA